MRPEAQGAAFLWDAITFARDVGVAVATTSLEVYLEGGLIVWATEHPIELVGEALNNLRWVASSFAERIPNVHKILATRNVLVHGYAEVDKAILWQAATRTIPRLLPAPAVPLARPRRVPDATSPSPVHGRNLVLASRLSATPSEDDAGAASG